MTHSETVKVELSAITKFALFTEAKKLLFLVQLNIICDLDGNLSLPTQLAQSAFTLSIVTLNIFHTLF